MNAFLSRLLLNPRLPLVLLPLVTILVFLPVVGHEFLGYDDSVNITGNKYLERLTADNILYFWQNAHLRLYIPLTYSVWSLLAALSRLISGGHGVPLLPAVFHGANILVHSATVTVVYLLLRRLQAVPWAAAAGALFFAFHPIQVAPVSWATGMKDLLAGFWSVMALWQYTIGAQSTGHPTKSRLHHSVALACFFLAMLAKPNAVVIPLLAGTLGWLELGQTRRRLLFDLAPWFVCIVPIVLMTTTVQTVTDPDLLAPLRQRILVAGDAICFYLYKLALPITLGPDYGRTVETVLAQPYIYLTGLVPYLLIGCLLWKRPQPLFTAACLFLLALLPVLGFIPFNFQQVSTVAGRYLYLSMLGPAFAISRWLPRTPGSTVKILFCLALIGLTAKSMHQQRYWKNPLIFDLHAVEVNPESWFFHNNLGNAYLAAGDTAKALESFKKSIELNPDYEIPYLNLGAVLKDTGQTDLAIAYYLKAIAINPNLPNAHNDLAMVYFGMGATDRALEHLHKALEIKPDYRKAYANLGIIYTSLNNSAAAIQAYQRALELKPNSARVLINLGALYKTLGDLESAITCFRKAIEFKPNRPEAYNNLGLLFLETGRIDEAIPLLSKATATELGAQSPVPWHNLGKALLAAGRKDEAIAALRQAIVVDPRYSPAYNDLAIAAPAAELPRRPDADVPQRGSAMEDRDQEDDDPNGEDADSSAR